MENGNWKLQILIINFISLYNIYDGKKKKWKWDFKNSIKFTYLLLAIYLGLLTIYLSLLTIYLGLLAVLIWFLLLLLISLSFLF